MSHSTPGADAPRPTRLAPAAALAALLTLSAVACQGAPATESPTGSPNPSSGPSSGPSAGPTAGPTIAGGIAHPTGAHDVVLRIESIGGFVPVEFTATYTPSFTLYGDGTVIWRDDQEMPPESSDNLMRATPLLIAKIDEATLQALLAEAVGPGGLGVAVGPYNEMMGADIPSTVFTIDAGDIPEPKRVEVVGLSPEMHPKNIQVVTALAGLAEKLRTFGDLVNEQAYAPAAWRGVLIPAEQAFGPVVNWPWKDISPDDFGGDNEFFRTRDLSPDQVGKLDIENLAGGVSGFAVQDGDDLYSFALRPVLPDEAAQLVAS